MPLRLVTPPAESNGTSRNLYGLAKTSRLCNLSQIGKSQGKDVVVHDLEPGELDVAVCLRRVQEGDEDSARSLLLYLTPLVTKIVRSHLPKRTAEEDLIQAVFVKVFTKLDQFNGSAPFTHWVSRVAVNTCLNLLAHERIRPELRYADLSEEEEAVVQNLASEEADLPGELQIGRERSSTNCWPC